MADTTRAAAALAAWGGDGLGLIAHLLAEVERTREGGDSMDTQRTGEEQQALDEFLEAMAPQGADAFAALNALASDKLEEHEGYDAVVQALALLTAVQVLANKICGVLLTCGVPVPRSRSEMQPLVDALTSELRRRKGEAPGLDTLEH